MVAEHRSEDFCQPESLPPQGSLGVLFPDLTPGPFRDPDPHGIRDVQGTSNADFLLDVLLVEAVLDNARSDERFSDQGTRYPHLGDDASVVNLTLLFASESIPSESASPSTPDAAGSRHHQISI